MLSAAKQIAGKFIIPTKKGMLSPLIFLLCYKRLRMDHWETNHFKISVGIGKKRKKINLSKSHRDGVVVTHVL